MNTRFHMKTVSLLGAALLCLGIVPNVHAVGGDDANTTTKIDKVTEGCQKEIAAKGQKYWGAWVKNVNACLDAAQKCDEASNGSKATDCRKKLLENAKGKCAVGKLDDGASTIGAGATLGRTKSDKPTLAKELAKYRDAVQKKCFDTPGVNLTSTTRGLGFTTGPFSNADSLMNVLNANQAAGVSCIAHRYVRLTTPTSQGGGADSSIPLTLRNLETAGFTMAEALNELQDGGVCGGTTTTTVPCPLSPGRYTITQGSGGILTVDGLPSFPFPSGGAIIQEAGPGDANCVHQVTVPFPGGFSSPVFCVPALLFTVEVKQTACGAGEIDSDGGADYTVLELGDTSDSSTVCSLPHAGPCTNGADSSVRVDVTVGDGTTDSCGGPGTANALVSIPVFTTTWQDVAFQCPDADGTYDAGTDNLIVSFPQTLDFTTDKNKATWTDIDGDGCSKAGAGPGGAGLTSTGACLDIGGGTITTAASGPIGSAGAPLFDLTFTTLLPNTVTGPAATTGATCASPPIIANPGNAVRCIP